MVRCIPWILVAICFAFHATTSSASDNSLQKASSWIWPENKKVIDQLQTFLESRPSGEKVPAAKARLSELQSIRGIGLLEGVVSIAAECEPQIAVLLQRLSTNVSVDSLPEIDAALSSVLANGGIPDWLKADCQLFACRSYVQHALYDEAMNKLQTLSLEIVSDPSTYLFNLAVCQHHLLQRDECVETLSKLLEREMDLPTRYAITARLMEADIKPLKEDSLDEISRLMNDVERRLVLGRTGKVVRDKQQVIVEKLEKKIDQMEQQLQQQQQQQQQKQKQQQQDQQNQKKQDPSNPLDQSQIPEVKGEGEVDSKDIGNAAGWGNLPPAKRQEALQNMTKDLPSHYREVIEAYFKRLSTSPKP